MTVKTKSIEKGLEDLFDHALHDIYYAEKKILKALPKMIKKADSDDLRVALEKHRSETVGQIEALEEIFESMGKRPRGQRCDAIEGILEESESLLEDFGNTAACDAAIIFSAQAVEHYEITRYGSMKAFAEALGHKDVAKKLDMILTQEKAADSSLSKIGESRINVTAAA